MGVLRNRTFPGVYLSAYVSRMAGITLERAEAQLALWLDADAKVAGRQQWTYQGRTFTAADAGEIRANIEFWDQQCKRLASGGIRVRGAIAL